MDGRHYLLNYLYESDGAMLSAQTFAVAPAFTPGVFRAAVAKLREIHGTEKLRITHFTPFEDAPGAEGGVADGSQVRGILEGALERARALKSSPKWWVDSLEAALAGLA